MAVDVGIVVTDYSWNERSRPVITINEKKTAASIQIGEGTDVHPIYFDIVGSSAEDLTSQLEGFAEIFAKAAEVTSR